MTHRGPPVRIRYRNLSNAILSFNDRTDHATVEPYAEFEAYPEEREVKVYLKSGHIKPADRVRPEDLPRTSAASTRGGPAGPGQLLTGGVYGGGGR